MLRRVERIDRDLEELENIQNSIREDRDYAGRLRESLIDESIRLDNLKGRIFSQIVINPPKNLVESLGGTSVNPRRSETTAQSRSKEFVTESDSPAGTQFNTSTGQVKAEPVKERDNKQELETKAKLETEKSAPSPAKKQQAPTSSGQKKGAPYRFVYSRPTGSDQSDNA